jgi:hypothetical protein
VRVTIGRIEVRAIHPKPEASPQPHQAETGPALTLDAYLKKRNGGS